MGQDFETDMRILTDQNKRSFFSQEIKLIILFRPVFNTKTIAMFHFRWFQIALSICMNCGMKFFAVDPSKLKLVTDEPMTLYQTNRVQSKIENL